MRFVLAGIIVSIRCLLRILLGNDTDYHHVEDNHWRSISVWELSLCAPSVQSGLLLRALRPTPRFLTSNVVPIV